MKTRIGITAEQITQRVSQQSRDTMEKAATFSASLKCKYNLPENLVTQYFLARLFSNETLVLLVAEVDTFMEGLGDE